MVLAAALPGAAVAVAAVLHLRRAPAAAPSAPSAPPEALTHLVERVGALRSEVGEALARQSRDVAEALSGQNARLAAAQAEAAERAREREAALSSAVADSTRALGESLLAQSARVNEALAAQNERLAATEQALADRLAASAADTAAALAAQNERLAEAMAGQTERVNRQLTEQFAATQDTARAIGERLAVIDAARGNIEALGAQVGTLAGILANKQQRGAFGEAQLRALVEDRLPPDAYSWQHTLSNRHRADCLINLPHPPGPVVVDSKFPLEAWRAGRDCADEATRAGHARAFAADVRKHVLDIAGKYLIPGETAEGALLFVPSEAIYADLHAGHPDLVEDAARRGIYVVSPSTLWAVLGTMRSLMHGVRIRAEAGKIQAAVRTLLDDTRRLDERVNNLKRHFDLAEKDIREIEISRDKILRTSGRIGDVDLEDPAVAPPEARLAAAALAAAPPAALPRA